MRTGHEVEVTVDGPGAAVDIKDFVELRVDSSEHGWSIFFFSGRKQRDLWLPGMSTATLTYGPNWIVTHPADVADQVAALFGGKTQIAD